MNEFKIKTFKIELEFEIKNSSFDFTDPPEAGKLYGLSTL